MEQVKICMACRKNLGKNVCIQCGRLVCDFCFSKERRLCVDCITGKVVKQFDNIFKWFKYLYSKMFGDEESRNAERGKLEKSDMAKFAVS